MAYECELGGGQRLVLDQQGTQTLLTLASSRAGQQQQSTQGRETGVWTAPPQVFATGGGWVIRLHTATGEICLQIQGSQLSQIESNTIGSALPLQVRQVEAPTMQPMQPMQAMQPMQPMQLMQPMQMGNMSMSLNPMEMRMGDMSLRMGEAQPPSSAAVKRFCSQCGAGVQPTDRFCASCGVRLGEA